MTPFDLGPCSNASAETHPDPDQVLLKRFEHVRETTRRLAHPLTAEDMLAQSMPDASPAKWHLAHTSWFFETFLLLPRGFPPFDPAFQYLFNSYYEALGERQPRAARGLMTRPSAPEVMDYRRHVEAGMRKVLAGATDAETAALVTLGLAHEEQHQELMLTDILHLFAQNRLKPAYLTPPTEPGGFGPTRPSTFTALGGGIVPIGSDGHGFSFDNEFPRHDVLLGPYRLADRLVTNEEWLAFMEDGGYRRADLWLSDGWTCRQAEAWDAPLYWEGQGGDWVAFGLHGLQPLVLDAPVVHVSFYEADAFARWAGARLPLEAEWEHAAHGSSQRGALLDEGDFTPRPAASAPLAQMIGDVWEWTASPYVGYPGFRPATGAVGEYNGKFMVNQMILRGGSCVTPSAHIRSSYRNFFQPHQRWQFSGLRLALD
ncbi:ergothioneine biosynthesis protein EgtB [Caulobacter sp. S45]|uniref:ergothioneine biosynthesis protein EgtB n=1 Tax=Caulobacter sp. S45 TaxID=1641861 RepID=UPI0015775427|nr:ergothioneine biosynthesis protein EgtB [Caulobacter sp. S45]